MAKKDKTSRNEKSASKKSVAKLAKAVDRLSVKVAALEKELASRLAGGSKQTGGQKTAQGRAKTASSTAASRKKATPATARAKTAPATAKAKAPAKPRAKTAKRAPQARSGAGAAARPDWKRTSSSRHAWSVRVTWSAPKLSPADLVGV